jgi:RNA polymerase sigma factor (TIGR02999 family)
MDLQTQVTGLLADLRNGQGDAWNRLFPYVYDELHRIAHYQLARQRIDHTLSTTGLVHEAYLKLVDQTAASYADRVHFLAVSSRAMRQVLIDYARKRNTAKRGGGWQRVPLEEGRIAVGDRADMLLALDEALIRLSNMNGRLGRVVECRFFGGMTEEETAAALGITDRTVRRDWTKARMWLYGEIYGDAS